MILLLAVAHMMGSVGTLMSSGGVVGGSIPINAIVTEAGEPITTEAGGILVTE